MAKSFLETLLGGVKDLTAGQSAGDLAGKARGAWDGQSTMAKGAIAGGLLAALLTGGGRRMIGTGVKLGGGTARGDPGFCRWQSRRARSDRRRHYSKQRVSHGRGRLRRVL